MENHCYKLNSVKEIVSVQIKIKGPSDEVDNQIFQKNLDPAQCSI